MVTKQGKNTAEYTKYTTKRYHKTQFIQQPYVD